MNNQPQTVKADLGPRDRLEVLYRPMGDVENFCFTQTCNVWLHLAIARKICSMKNIQVIDGADNATFSIFQATDAEFEAIFPDGRDMEIAEDFFERLGEARARAFIEPIWERPILKRDALGIHGTIYYGWSGRREYLPASKREMDIVDVDPWSINEAQRRLFTANR